jgi:hypothetical protein
MRFRTTLILFIVLAALAGYLYFVELPQEQAAQEEQRVAQELVAFREPDVTGITLRYPDHSAALERRDGGWIVTEPLQYDADAREVQSLITTLTDQSATRVIEENSRELAEFGFDRPAVDIVYRLGDRSERVLIGADGPMPNTLFLRRDSDGKVVLAEQWIRGSLTRRLYDLRAKQVVKLDTDAVTGLALDFPKQPFRLEKQDGSWRIIAPRPYPGDADQIGSLLITLQNLRALQFIDAEADKAALRKRLKRPEVIVTATTADSDVSVSFFRDRPKGAAVDTAYAVTAADRPIYEVAVANLDELKPLFYRFADKRLAVFEPDAIDQIGIRTPQETYRLTRAASGWTLDGATEPVNAELVTRLLDHLGQLRASAPAPAGKQAAGLNPGRYEIQLLGSGRPVATVRIGRESDGSLYAQGPEPLGPVLISRDVLDNIPKRSELIKPATPATEGGAPADPSSLSPGD